MKSHNSGTENNNKLVRFSQKLEEDIQNVEAHVPLSKICLTDRDRKILLHLFKKKIMTLSQVQEIFFPNASKQAASCRLSKLSKHEYLNRKAISIDGNTQVGFIIQPKGVQQIRKYLDHRIIQKYYVSDFT